MSCELLPLRTASLSRSRGSGSKRPFRTLTLVTTVTYRIAKVTRGRGKSLMNNGVVPDTTIAAMRVRTGDPRKFVRRKFPRGDLRADDSMERCSMPSKTSGNTPKSSPLSTFTTHRRQRIALLRTVRPQEHFTHMTVATSWM